MTDGSEVPLRATRDRRLAEEWALVLVTQGLSPILQAAPDGEVVLRVRAEEREAALAALSAYEQENPPKPRQAEPDWPAAPNLDVGMAVAAVLLISHFAADVWSQHELLLERGSARAGRILSGELWRTVTALTLHADVAHVLSNAVAAAIFVAALASLVGAGLALALFVLAGAGGNLVNAIFYGPPHAAIGASTAVFGAVGTLGGIGMMRRRRSGLRRAAWAPLAAALALLAMLGTGAGRVDVLAHLFGFLVGAVAGVVVGRIAPEPPAPRTQWLCGGGAAALVILSWAIALR